jgi:hypothetical protein
MLQQFRVFSETIAQYYFKEYNSFLCEESHGGGTVGNAVKTME